MSDPTQDHVYSNPHLSTECVFRHPKVPVNISTKFATTNVKLLIQELLQQQLADFAQSASQEDPIADLTTVGVKILRKYPRSAGEIPCITINRASHRQSLSGLGEVISQDAEKELRAVRQEERIEIQVYADNEDLRDALYAYVAQTIARYRIELARYGCETIILVDGNDDEVEDQLFTNSYLYRGTQIYIVTGEMQIEDTFIVAKAVNTAISPTLGGSSFGLNVGVEIERIEKEELNP